MSTPQNGQTHSNIFSEFCLSLFDHFVGLALKGLRKIRSGCPEQLLYADNLALVSKSLEGSKWKIETWERALELKELRVNDDQYLESWKG